jgi:hypothetical protein
MGAVVVISRSSLSGALTKDTTLVPNNVVGFGKIGTSVGIGGSGTAVVFGGPMDSFGLGAAWIFEKVNAYRFLHSYCRKTLTLFLLQI